MSKWEKQYGFRRAIRAGDLVLSAGTAVPGTEADAATQARMAFGIALDALFAQGVAIDDVVRTRMYITDRADADAVGEVHGALFGAVRPVTTMVVVAGLIEPGMRVEVEVEAFVGETKP